MDQASFHETFTFWREPFFFIGAEKFRGDKKIVQLAKTFA